MLYYKYFIIIFSNVIISSAQHLPDDNKTKNYTVSEAGLYSHSTVAVLINY